MFQSTGGSTIKPVKHAAENQVKSTSASSHQSRFSRVTHLSLLYGLGHFRIKRLVEGRASTNRGVFDLSLEQLQDHLTCLMFCLNLLTLTSPTAKSYSNY